MNEETSSSPALAPPTSSLIVGKSMANSQCSSQTLARPPPHSWLQNLRRPRTSQGPKSSRQAKTSLPLSRSSDDVRANAALRSTSPTLMEESPCRSPEYDVAKRTSGTSTLPVIVVGEDRMACAVAAQTGAALASNTYNIPDFHGLTTSIPNGNLEDLSSPDKINFSQRGSILLDGKKLVDLADRTVSARQSAMPTDRSAHKDEVDVIQEGMRASTPEPASNKDDFQRKSPGKSPRLRTNATARLNIPSVASSKALSLDEETLSRKVRAMYEHGSDNLSGLPDQDVIEEDDETSNILGEFAAKANTSTSQVQQLRSSTPDSRRPNSMLSRQPHETAGGIEDWEHVDVGEVDRYGFIQPKRAQSRDSHKAPEGFEMHGMQRVSTALMEVSRTPRRRQYLGRPRSRPRSFRSDTNDQKGKALSHVPNSSGSIYSYRSTNSITIRANTLRHASNHFPHNRDRRWMDEASNMLTLPPGLAQLEENKDGGKAALMLKRKEWRREDKWRRMGRTTQGSTKGGGMLFEFNTRDPKVVSRTWKGIPDRWRASAWYSFLATSAKAQNKGQPDDELIAIFHLLQGENSADDVQIDCDVPRTINRHIMFRRRYRGGQRLLFRVLHAFSLYFPDTGYVQGMAALVATLLCYFDEEHAFVMMVRLWQVRGLERLYQPGFGGLMEALDDFEKNWLRGGEVAKKLEELGITSTAYGTRWYLTLFNYSIPFPAQLRVWDVFMLLGDVSNAPKQHTAFEADLDVLHATSAALIDATQEILLDSDFENGMKVLTSWIPIKDEDLLMKVAHAEWKLRKKRT